MDDANACFQLLACLSLVLLPRRTIRQYQFDRCHFKYRNPKDRHLASFKAFQAPTSADLRSIAYDRWARPSMATEVGGRASGWHHGGSSGKPDSPSFHRNLYERILKRLWLFLCWCKQSNGEMVQYLFPFPDQCRERSRRRQKAQTKKIPHTRLPTSLRILPPLAASRTVAFVNILGEDERRLSLTVS